MSAKLSGHPSSFSLESRPPAVNPAWRVDNPESGLYPTITPNVAENSSPIVIPRTPEVLAQTALKGRCVALREELKQLANEEDQLPMSDGGCQLSYLDLRTRSKHYNKMEALKHKHHELYEEVLAKHGLTSNLTKAQKALIVAFFVSMFVAMLLGSFWYLDAAYGACGVMALCPVVAIGVAIHKHRKIQKVLKESIPEFQQMHKDLEFLKQAIYMFNFNGDINLRSLTQHVKK